MNGLGGREHQHSLAAAGFVQRGITGRGSDGRWVGRRYTDDLISGARRKRRINRKESKRLRLLFIHTDTVVADAGALPVLRRIKEGRGEEQRSRGGPFCLWGGFDQRVCTEGREGGESGHRERGEGGGGGGGGAIQPCEQSTYRGRESDRASGCASPWGWAAWQTGVGVGVGEGGKTFRGDDILPRAKRVARSDQSLPHSFALSSRPPGFDQRVCTEGREGGESGHRERGEGGGGGGGGGAFGLLQRFLYLIISSGLNTSASSSFDREKDRMHMPLDYDETNL
ncbi:hypothetical protein MARPO_0003s0212 [Marchantia polymorpha]|uniref:Uncharacterized protein n=1 Tax=Marchantia polymorpha TaxID=3197 RepID=A0A2R6XTB3_MARPO|nr:hypothetical protein MARPO_0003s0212 [Marchantia polymorpha]|eukprot:PTQ49339.1 hypothetical protein MARPO_0003s0212 [Marchantia polymorpha]